ncbi:helix-turn-helix domain-containing protein [Candidatus Parcubacteria bacterium]|nr:helix-turn-helix domain-containing protein [Candidatus Parcubacteria bacterium]
MTITSIKSFLPEKSKMDKFKNVKSQQDLRDVFILEELKNNYWAATLHKILFDETISDGAKVLWAILQSIGDVEGHSFWGQKKLAIIAGKSKRTVQRRIQELEKTGWLKVKSGGYNRGNHYFVIWPAGCKNPKLNGAIAKSKAMGKRYESYPQ